MRISSAPALAILTVSAPRTPPAKAAAKPARASAAKIWPFRNKTNVADNVPKVPWSLLVAKTCNGGSPVSSSSGTVISRRRPPAYRQNRQCRPRRPVQPAFLYLPRRSQAPVRGGFAPVSKSIRFVYVMLQLRKGLPYIGVGWAFPLPEFPVVIRVSYLCATLPRRGAR